MIDELTLMGLDEDQARVVARWHMDRCSSALARMIDYLVRGHRDALWLRLLGVAFGCGMQRLTGYRTETDAAHGEGCTPQAVSQAARKAKKAIFG